MSHHRVCAVPSWPYRASPRQLRDRQKQRQLPLDEVRELIARYLAGATVLELAEAFGVHRTTALALLERNDVPRRGRVWTPELTDRAVRLYAEGRSCASIARGLEVSPETVRHHLVTAGDALGDLATRAPFLESDSGRVNRV